MILIVVVVPSPRRISPCCFMCKQFFFLHMVPYLTCSELRNKKCCPLDADLLRFFFFILPLLLYLGSGVRRVLTWKASIVWLEKRSTIWDFRVAMSECRLSEDLNCQWGCWEHKRKTLKLIEMPSGQNAKDWWTGRTPWQRLVGFVWELKSKAEDPGYCWVVID